MLKLMALQETIWTKKNAKKIGNALGNFLEVDVDPQFGIACKMALRIKVEIDITKPLKIGFWFPRDHNIDS